jgi:pyroglutamyl-peptidase
MLKVLVAAFDPYGGQSINAAAEAVRLLPERLLDADLVKVEIPTVFAKSLEVLYATVDREQPDIILGVGQAGGRTGISAERVAINVDDARIKDNEGNQPEDEPIFRDGPVAYFSGLPIKEIVNEIKAHGLPASVSNTAGTFVCNHLMYGLLHRIATQSLNMRGGFVHVPYTHRQVLDKVGTPSMAVSDIVKGLELAIQATVRHAAR